MPSRLTRYLPVLAGAVTAALVLAAVYQVDAARQKERMEKQRADVLSQLGLARAQLETSLISRLYLSRGLVALAASHPDVSDNEFQPFARALFRQQAGVRSIQLARGTVVRHVYPLSGNQAAAGLQLLDLPEQREGVLRAIREHRTVLEGPVGLVQGGDAFVSRTPVFLKDGHLARDGDFWGLATVIIDRDVLFTEAGLNALPSLRLAISSKEEASGKEAIFWRNAPGELSQPVHLEVAVPGGSWRLDAMPRAGWSVTPDGGLYAVGTGLALVSGLLVAFLARNPRRLQEMVERTTQALKASEARKQALLGAMPDLMFLQNKDGVYLDYHAADPAMLAMPPERFLGKRMGDILPELARLFDAPFREVLATGNMQVVDYMLPLANGTRHFEARVVRCESDCLLTIIRDMTEARLAEETLKRQAQIINQVHESVIATDLLGRITFWNRGAEKMLGYTEAEVIGRPMANFYQDSGHPGILPNVLKHLETHEVYESESRRMTKDGRLVHVHLSLSLLRNRAGEPAGLVGYAVDITERKNLERQIIDVSEEEQKRIGQELHDGLGQHLTGIAFLCKALEQKLAAEGSSGMADAAGITGFVNQAVSQTRLLARGLFPVELEANGLMSALEQLAVNVHTLFGVACEFHCATPVLVYDKDVAINLYRIAQEAVNNAIKHGRARHVGMVLAGDATRPWLEVRDDGTGFGQEEKDARQGMGLHIMEYRARMIGASLGIRRGEQGGTVVSVR